MKKVIIIYWFFLTIAILTSFALIAFYGNKEQFKEMLNHLSWNRTDAICVGVGSIALIAGLISAMIIGVIIDSHKRAEKLINLQHLLDTQKEWKTICEDKVNGFLNSKFKITLEFARFDDTTILSSLYVNILVENRYQCFKRLYLDHSMDISKIPDDFANQLFVNYQQHGKNSSLFNALKTYTEFIKEEKLWAKPTKAVKTTNS